MKYEKYWTNQEKKKIKRPNSFARKAVVLIKKRGLKKILDLGCGRSSDAILFAQNDLEVVALDMAKNRMLTIRKEAEKQGVKNIRFVSQDIRKIDFPDNSFDIIYAHCSLHYFDDKTTSAIFKRLHKMLRQNGLLFVMCRSTNDPLCGKGEKVDKNTYNLDGHLRHFFTKNYMEEKLSSFKILELEEISFVYPGKKHKSFFIEAIAVKLC